MATYIESEASSISSSESSTGADTVVLSSRRGFFLLIGNSKSLSSLSSLLLRVGIVMGVLFAKSRRDRFGRGGKSKRGMVLVLGLLTASSIGVSKEDRAG